MRRPLTEIAPGVLVATSERYTTTSTVVAGRDGGALVIDPAVTAADLRLLAAELAQAGLRPAAGFATHPHWDHVLWCPELGDVPRYASRRAVQTAESERDGLVAGLAEAGPGHDLGLFGRLIPLAPGSTGMAWAGPDTVVVTHDGHAPGHSAIFLPDTGTLVAGDMCSDIEIPLLDLAGDAPFGDYRAGLERLAALPVALVVPGHGTVGDAAEFRRRVAADAAYLDEIERGHDAGDERLTLDWLRTQHQLQLEHMRGPAA
jgi:hydroxyacylglutathione hydrolase